MLDVDMLCALSGLLSLGHHYGHLYCLCIEDCSFMLVDIKFLEQRAEI